MHSRPDSALSATPGASSLPVPRSIGRVIAATAVVGAAALLTWAAAEVRIPLQPVPITLQTLVVLLAGALIGPARGTASQVTYLGMGLAGAPIFAAGAAGVTALSGPTGGYLLGFAVAPVIVARCIGTRRGFVRALLGFSAGALAILALGVAHLAVLYTHDLATAVRVGFLPFVPGDALKVLAAASIYCGYRRLLAERSAC